VRSKPQDNQADTSRSAAVDSTANTNLVHWGGHLLALKEVALVSLFC
jgi:hypothetical protein